MRRSEYETKMADLQNQIEELKKVEIEEDVKEWKPRHGDKYYYITERGHVENDSWQDWCEDRGRYSIGNCFATQDDAEFALESLKVNIELRKFAERDGAEWGGNTEHYYIYYDLDEHAIDTGWTHSSACAELYFATEKDAEMAIEAVGEARIKKYYLRMMEGEQK